MSKKQLLSKIPKDLPVTNPLLFCFIIIIDAIKINCKINGKAMRDFEKDLPAFEFAVNNWTVTENNDSGQKNKVLSQEVLCALWKEKPDPDDCETIWMKFPNDDETERKHDMSFLYDFEDWRNRTFNEVEQIISALVYEPVGVPPSQKRHILKNIFGWDIQGGLVNYVYAIDSTANQFYGVGATFTLLSPFKNCCPKIDDTKLQLNYFKSLGFVFDELNP